MHKIHFSAARPPVADKKMLVTQRHGVQLSDPYAWMRADNWQQVLREPQALPQTIRHLIEAENSYADDVLVSSVDLQKVLVTEMRNRMEPDETAVPVPDGDFAYYSRFRDGGQHPLFCRTLRDGGAETILLDGDAMASGKAFFDIGDVMHDPGHRLLAWSVDDQGSEFFTLSIREIESGRELPDVLKDTDGHAVWSADSTSLYYVRMDSNHRPMSVWQHRLGEAQTADRLVFEETDPAWFVSIHASLDGQYCVITIKDHDSSECRLVDLRQPFAKPELITARKNGLRYSVSPHGSDLYCLTNAEGAENFKITCRNEAGIWRDVVAHRAGCLIVSVIAFKNVLVRLERENCLPRIVLRDLQSGAETSIDFAEEAYSLALHDLHEFASPFLRFTYSSMTTPAETYDYDLQSGARALRKRQSVPSGHVPADYVTKRLFARGHDGAEIPVTLLYKKGLAFPAPVLLYAYGAYGHAIPASFSTNRLSLVDRGFIHAIAHVRGGMDKGYDWYAKGKLEYKTNTFRDFVSSAEHLIAAGLTRQGQIVAQGGSAGGMLMGAIANMAPQLFGGIIADVPFVDVLNTMLDDTLPLTPPEWLEWGNPIEDEAAFARMKAYSPYDAVSRQAYPPILALAGLTDPRVTYWEPLKWVSKLRDMMLGGGPILLKTNMDAGHGGASGRFDQLDEVALCQAFALTCRANPEA